MQMKQRKWRQSFCKWEMLLERRHIQFGDFSLHKCCQTEVLPVAFHLGVFEFVFETNGIKCRWI